MYETFYNNHHHIFQSISCSEGVSHSRISGSLHMCNIFVFHRSASHKSNISSIFLDKSVINAVEAMVALLCLNAAIIREGEW